MRGHLGKRLHGNREMIGDWAVGVWVHRDSWLRVQIGASPEPKYQRSRIVFTVTSIALRLGLLGSQLLGLPAQSLTGSPGALVQAPLQKCFGQALPDFLITVHHLLPFLLYLQYQLYGGKTHTKKKVTASLVQRTSVWFSCKSVYRTFCTWPTEVLP